MRRVLTPRWSSTPQLPPPILEQRLYQTDEDSLKPDFSFPSAWGAAWGASGNVGAVLRPQWGGMRWQPGEGTSRQRGPEQ